VNDWLNFVVPRRAVGLYILYHCQQQFLLAGFMVVFSGALPSLFLHSILFVWGDYVFYKNINKMLK
jgi:hypothetical protein